MSNHDHTAACPKDRLRDRHRDRPTLARCGCGQELDVCTSDHCPRCGAHLDQDPADSVRLVLSARS